MKIKTSVMMMTEVGNDGIYSASSTYCSNFYSLEL